MELRTESYILRTLMPADATERYLSWLRDGNINRTLEVDGEAVTKDSLIDYISSHDGVTSYLFGIYTKNKLHIGTHSFRFYPAHKLATVGTMIGDQSYWGKGIPLETRGKILQWAFDEMGCNKIEAGCYSINLPSIYNFQKQQWTLEGIREDHRIIENRSVDLILFGMTREVWHGQS